MCAFIFVIHFTSGDLTVLKNSPIIIKEGAPYRVKIEFRVQREIVAGLRYFQNSYRKGIRGMESGESAWYMY